MNEEEIRTESPKLSLETETQTIPISMEVKSVFNKERWRNMEELYLKYDRAKEMNLSSIKDSENEYLDKIKQERINISDFLRNDNNGQNKLLCINVINTLHKGIKISKDTPELLKEQVSLLSENIETLDNILKSRVLKDNKYALETLLDATMDIIQFSDNPDVNKKALDLLLINSYKLYDINHKNSIYYRFKELSKEFPPLMEELKQIESTIKPNEIASSIAGTLFYNSEVEKYSEEEKEFLRRMSNYPISEEKIKLAQEELEKLLVSSNLDVNLIQEAWKMSSENRPRLAYEKNISAIIQLENRIPGICAELFNKFGICNFGRYPIEMLIKQYEQRNDKDVKYGVAIFPYNDHSGAFYNQDSIRKLYNAASIKNYSIRITEVDTLRKLYKQMLSFDQFYGENNKISFVSIYAHGNPEQLHFSNKYYIYKEDENRKYAYSLGILDSMYITHSLAIQRDKVQKYLVKNPIIILNSCSTGEEKGIAQTLSEKLKSKVIGPNVTVQNVLDVQLINKNDNDFDLNVEYENIDYRIEKGIIYDNRVEEERSSKKVSRN